jgi:hypothetical protein
MAMEIMGPLSPHQSGKERKQYILVMG